MISPCRHLPEPVQPRMEPGPALPTAKRAQPSALPPLWAVPQAMGSAGALPKAAARAAGQSHCQRPEAAFSPGRPRRRAPGSLPKPPAGSRYGVTVRPTMAPWGKRQRLSEADSASGFSLEVAWVVASGWGSHVAVTTGPGRSPSGSDTSASRLGLNQSAHWLRVETGGHRGEEPFVGLMRAASLHRLARQPRAG